MNFRLPLLATVGLLFAGCGPQGLSVPSVFSFLKPQAYTWYPERSSSGPVLVYVSLPRQEVVVYRNGIRIGRASVSTGRPGNATPTGVFQILEKKVVHHSSTYDNAPMPHMERLTWDGVALHAGFNPGQPDSHGCIRLPAGFAKELYGVTSTGGTVIITNSKKLPSMTLAEGFVGGGGGSWSGKGKSSAAAIVVSLASRKIQVYQSGRKVGESPVEVSGSLTRFKGETVFLFASDNQWRSVDGNAAFPKMKEDLRVPDSFSQKIRSVVQPGTTMVITSESFSPRDGQIQSVLTGD